MLHKGFNNTEAVLVEFLEIVAEISHDVVLFEKSLQKIILHTHTLDKAIFGLADRVNIASIDKLLFVAVNGPTDVSWYGTIVSTIC